MIHKENHIYTFEGWFNYDFMKNLKGEFKGQISPDSKGFFRNGHFFYDDNDCKMIGHIKNDNSFIKLSFILTLDDVISLDGVYNLTNVTSKYNSATKDLEGDYVGKWRFNLNPQPPKFDSKVLSDYKTFENLTSSVWGLGGQAELRLLRK
jgi:hypothetical protein